MRSGDSVPGAAAEASAVASPARNGPGIRWLVLAQLLSGIGVASGVAVGGVLAESLAGTASAAGTASTASIVGAGLVALPLAAIAARHGRRGGLAVGFGLGALGAAVVLTATISGQYWLLLIGMVLFGSATAAGLQSRYAAAELARPERRATTMSVVIWSTTVGSVIGPNLSQPGSDLGERFGVPSPAGPYLLSVAVFVIAAMAMLIGLPRVVPGAEHGGRGGTGRALLAALRAPGTRLGIVAVVAGHAMMVSVMVMTPVHMHHQGMSLTLVGIVISVHVLGMYALSPVFGWLADRIGARWVVWIGAALFVGAFVLGGLSPQHPQAHGEHATSPVALTIALLMLGLGWSACLIGGSALIAAGQADGDRMRLQGAVDSSMSLFAAVLAALAGPVLALGGYPSVNLLGAAVLAALVVVALTSRGRS